MSMKYYAVTDDPNELLHYGVKGMKWGKHLFGDDLRPKSKAYRNAVSKLKSFSKKAKTAIKKSSVQRAANRQMKQQEKYNKAVERTQQRINQIEGLNNLNRLMDYERQVNQNYKEDRKASKKAMRIERKYAKNEKKMDKFMQEAREGRLKYGQLSDEQVRTITNRLALERNARILGNTEKSKFRTRMKDALQEGILQGVAGGTAAGMTEVAKAAIQNRRKNRKELDRKAEQQAERDRITNRIRNKRTKKEMEEDFRSEAYETQLEEGLVGKRATKKAAKQMRKIEEDQHERARARAIQDRIKNDFDLEGNREYQKLLEGKAERDRVRRLNETMNNALDMDRNKAYQELLGRQEEQRFLTQESQNVRRNIRQNRENEEREERKLRLEGEREYLYGLTSGNNSGGKGNKGDKNNKDGGSGSNTTGKGKYYEQRYVKGKTLQQENADKAANDAFVSDVVNQFDQIGLNTRKRIEQDSEKARNKAAERAYLIAQEGQALRKKYEADEAKRQTELANERRKQDQALAKSMNKALRDYDKKSRKITAGSSSGLSRKMSPGEIEDIGDLMGGDYGPGSTAYVPKSRVRRKRKKG